MDKANGAIPLVHRKILVMGLPGAGKTTLARALAPRLNAVHFNADAVRANINADLGFAHADRVEQARRMGWLCDRVIEAGGFAVADFVCPTAETRQAFGDCFVIWVDRTDESPYADTNAMFERPARWNIRVTRKGSPAYWAQSICEDLLHVFDPQAPTALFIGRYQPFHDGHRRLIEKGLRRVGQACIAVRNTRQDPGSQLSFCEVKDRIEAALAEHRGRFQVVQLPNVSHVFHGPKVGYVVEQLLFDEATERISATDARRERALNEHAPRRALDAPEERHARPVGDRAVTA